MGLRELHPEVVDSPGSFPKVPHILQSSPGGQGLGEDPEESGEQGLSSHPAQGAGPGAW